MLGASFCCLHFLILALLLRVQVIEKESRALQKQFGTPRRTQLEKEKDGEVSDEDVIANQECILVRIPT